MAVRRAGTRPDRCRTCARHRLAVIDLATNAVDRPAAHNDNSHRRTGGDRAVPRRDLGSERRRSRVGQGAPTKSANEGPGSARRRCWRRARKSPPRESARCKLRCSMPPAKRDAVVGDDGSAHRSACAAPRGAVGRRIVDHQNVGARQPAGDTIRRRLRSARGPFQRRMKTVTCGARRNRSRAVVARCLRRVGRTRNRVSRRARRPARPECSGAFV